MGIEWLHYMVNFLNYISQKANVFLKASLIDCWLWNSFIEMSLT